MFFLLLFLSIIFLSIFFRWADFLEGNKTKSWDYWVKPYVPKFYAKIVHANELMMSDPNNPNFNPYHTFQPMENKQNPKIMLKNNENNIIKTKSLNESDQYHEIEHNLKEILKMTKSSNENDITHPPMCKEEFAKQLLQTLKPIVVISTESQDLGEKLNAFVKAETNATYKIMSNPNKKSLNFTAEEFKPPEI